MSVQSIYLDTSAIVKRYVIEEESASIDALYEKAHIGKLKIGFSIWNIGEVAVVLDKYERRGIVKDAKAIFMKFIGETRLLVKLNQLKLIPLNIDVLAKAIGYIFKHGIYVADAIQLVSAKEFEAFLTYDRKLAQIAEVEGLKLAT
ncbi:MAG: PIN domain nuclease [Thermoprotei archaeon]|nr:MAG: PIN domain nuclease [Thermoprotei archaeon]